MRYIRIYGVILLLSSAKVFCAVQHCLNVYNPDNLNVRSRSELKNTSSKHNLRIFSPGDDQTDPDGLERTMGPGANESTTDLLMQMEDSMREAGSQ